MWSDVSSMKSYWPLAVLVVVSFALFYFVLNKKSNEKRPLKELSEKEPLHVLKPEAVSDENPSIVFEENVETSKIETDKTDAIVVPKKQFLSKFFQVNNDAYSDEYVEALQLSRETGLMDRSETRRMETSEDDFIPTMKSLNGPAYIDEMSPEARILAADVHQDIPTSNDETTTTVLREILSAKKEASMIGYALDVSEQQKATLLRISLQRGTLGHLAKSILNH